MGKIITQLCWEIPLQIYVFQPEFGPQTSLEILFPSAPFHSCNDSFKVSSLPKTPSHTHCLLSARVCLLPHWENKDLNKQHHCLTQKDPSRRKLRFILDSFLSFTQPQPVPRACPILLLQCLLSTYASLHPHSYKWWCKSFLCIIAMFSWRFSLLCLACSPICSLYHTLKDLYEI